MVVEGRRAQRTTEELDKKSAQAALVGRLDWTIYSEHGV